MRGHGFAVLGGALVGSVVGSAATAVWLYGYVLSRVRRRLG